MRKLKIFSPVLYIVCGVLLLDGCAAQIVLDNVLKRDAAKDLAKYEKRMDKFAARYPDWTARLKDTCMFSPNNGAKLHAVYMAAPTPTLKTAFILHGHTDSAAGMMREARWYNETLGYNVFLPDFYAHGLSEGKYRQMGWLDRFDFIEWMKIANGIFGQQGGDGQETRMVVTGVSMGGAATMMVSAEVQREGLTFVKCFIEDCGYTDFYSQAAYLAPKVKYAPKNEKILRSVLDETDRRCKRKYGWSFSEASALGPVAECTLPVLFIHGDADTYVPTSMVYELYDAKVTGDKELLIVPGAKHAASSRTDIYRSTVKAFLDKYL